MYPDTPSRVEYGLPPLGQTLVEALTVLRDWTGERYHEVEATRSRCFGEPNDNGDEVNVGA